MAASVSTSEASGSVDTADANVYGPEVFQVEHKLMQKAVVFFLWAEGASVTDIDRRFQAIYGAGRISQSTIARCTANFRRGERCVLTRAPTGRPQRIGSDPELLARFQDAMQLTAGRVPVRELGRLLGISYSTAANMKRSYLGGGKAVDGLRLVRRAGPSQLRYARVHSHLCKLCGQRTPSRLALKQHIRNVHIEAGEGTSALPPAGDVFKCEQCDKTFDSEYSLNGHRPIHVRRKYKLQSKKLLNGVQKDAGNTYSEVSGENFACANENSTRNAENIEAFAQSDDT